MKMRRIAFGGMAAIVMLACACSPQAQDNRTAEAATGTMDHLRCAALISAADQLINTGRLAADPAFSQAALVAGMTHLNAYAIPRGLAEKLAFAQLHAERDKIIGGAAAAQILDEAKACIASTPR